MDHYYGTPCIVPYGTIEIFCFGHNLQAFWQICFFQLNGNITCKTNKKMLIQYPSVQTNRKQNYLVWFCFLFFVLCAMCVSINKSEIWSFFLDCHTEDYFIIFIISAITGQSMVKYIHRKQNNGSFHFIRDFVHRDIFVMIMIKDFKMKVSKSKNERTNEKSKNNIEKIIGPSWMDLNMMIIIIIIIIIIIVLVSIYKQRRWRMIMVVMVVVVVVRQRYLQQKLGQ